MHLKREIMRIFCLHCRYYHKWDCNPTLENCLVRDRLKTEKACQYWNGTIVEKNIPNIPNVKTNVNNISLSAIMYNIDEIEILTIFVKIWTIFVEIWTIFLEICTIFLEIWTSCAHIDGVS